MSQDDLCKFGVALDLWYPGSASIFMVTSAGAGLPNIVWNVPRSLCNQFWLIRRARDEPLLHASQLQS